MVLPKTQAVAAGESRATERQVMTVGDALRQIREHPEFRRSLFSIATYSLGQGKMLHCCNGETGALRDIVPTSKAAGKVPAKTGTHVGPNPLTGGMIVNAKALTSFTAAPSGDRAPLAVFLNSMPTATRLDDPATMMNATSRASDTTVAKITAAANLLPITGRRTPTQ